MQTEYVVMRNFHMGEITQNLVAGERLAFNGNEMTRVKNGLKYTVTGLSMLTRSRLIVEDDGTHDFKQVEETVQAPKQPTMPVNIQNDDERIVATIKLPEKVNGRTRKSTEEVAKTTAATAPRILISEDQRVVGKANVRTIPIAKKASAKDVEVIQSEQEATVVSSTGDKMKSAMDEAMKAEGFGPRVTGGGMEIVSDQSEGTVVAKIESLAVRKERLKQEAVADHRARVEAASRAIALTDAEKENEQSALADNIRLALAKRTGNAPTAASKTRTASVSEKVSSDDISTTNGYGYPEGFPHNGHWRKRLDWCKANSSKYTLLNIVYTKSTESFQNQLVKHFPDVVFAAK